MPTRKFIKQKKMNMCEQEAHIFYSSIQTISIMKLLPCVCLCPSENLHCSKEFHASPNERTAKPYLHECAIPA